MIETNESIAKDLILYGIKLANYEEICREIDECNSESDYQTTVRIGLLDEIKAIANKYPKLDILKNYLKEQK